MKITVVKQKDKAMKTFEKKEWDIADQKHYDKAYDWNPKNVSLVAYDGKKIVGIANLKIEAGVVEIQTFLVSSEKSGKGIEESLLEKIGSIAKEHHAHKLYAVTGKGWDMEKFYQTYGMIQTGSLLKHFLKHDFVEYTKYI